MDVADEFRDQRSEVRGRRSEGQEQKTEVGGQSLRMNDSGFFSMEP